MSSDGLSSGNIQTASALAESLNPLPPPVVLALGWYNMDRVFHNLQFAEAYTTILNYTRTIRPRVRANSLKHTKCIFFYK